MAAVYLALEQPTQALAYVEQIMPRLSQVTAAGVVEPFRIYLTCYRVLARNHDLRAGPPGGARSAPRRPRHGRGASGLRARSGVVTRRRRPRASGRPSRGRWAPKA
ncbi:MAG TPA: hypothetical protein PKE45_16885, partial [Caldilineaceae bacterium]|nr:hypothetical protein [Caldilineaceae bacterium]